MKQNKLSSRPLKARVLLIVFALLFAFTACNETKKPTDSEAVAAAKTALSWDSIKGANTAQNNVTANLTLPATGDNEVTISWASSSTDVIAVNGTVTRPAESAADASVTLTATLTKGNESDTKTFDLTVPKLALTDAETVAAAKTALTWDSIKGTNAAQISVTENLALTTTGANGVTITWASNNTIAIAVNGTVTRPAYTAADASVTLTATLTKGTASDTLTFDLTVPKLALTDAEAVAAAKDALVWDSIKGANIFEESVTASLTLSTTGANGVAISWASNNTDVIAVNGTVTRPSYLTGDAEVILTATLTKGSASDAVTFNLTVASTAGENADFRFYISGTDTEAENLRILANDDYLGVTSGQSITLTVKNAADGQTTPANYVLNVVSLNPGVLSVSRDGTNITVSGIGSGKGSIVATLSGGIIVEAEIDSWIKLTTKTQLDKLGVATWELRDNASKLEQVLGGHYFLGNNIDYAGATILPIASAPIYDSNLFSGITPVNGVQRFSTESHRWKQILGLADFSEFNDGVNPLKKAFTGVLDGNGYAIQNAHLFTDNYLIANDAWTAFFLGGGHFMGLNSGTLRNISFEGLRYYHKNDITTLYTEGETINSRTDPSGTYETKPGPANLNAVYSGGMSFVHANNGLVENVRITYKNPFYYNTTLLGSTMGVLFNFGTTQNLAVIQEGGVWGELTSEGKLAGGADVSQYAYNEVYLGNNNSGTFNDSFALSLLQILPNYHQNAMAVVAFDGVRLGSGLGTNVGKFQSFGDATLQQNYNSSATDVGNPAISLKAAVDAGTFSLASFDTSIWAIDLNVAGAGGITMIPGNFWDSADAAAVAAAKAALSWNEIKGGNAAQNNVTESLELPATGADGVAISWTSNGSAVNAANGAVTQPSFMAGDANIILTATLTRGAAKATVTFKLTVPSVAAGGADFKFYLSGTDTEAQDVRILANDEYLGVTGGQDITLTLKKADASSLQAGTVTGFTSLDSDILSVARNGDSVTVSGVGSGNGTIRAALAGGLSIDIEIESWIKITTKAQLDKLGLATWEFRNDAAKLEQVLGGYYVLGVNIDYAGATILPIACAPIYDRSMFDGFGSDAEYQRFSTQSHRWKNILGLADYSEFNDGVNPLKKAFTGIFDGNGYAVQNAQLFSDNYLIANPTWTAFFLGGGHFMGMNHGILRNVSFEGLCYYHPADIKPLYTEGETITSRTDPSGTYETKPGPANLHPAYSDMMSFVHANNGLIENVRITYKNLSHQTASYAGTTGVLYNYGTVQNLVVIQEGGVYNELTNAGMLSGAGDVSQYAQYDTYLGNNKTGTFKDSFALTLMQILPNYHQNSTATNSFAGINLGNALGSNVGKFQSFGDATLQQNYNSSATDVGNPAISLKAAVDAGTYSLDGFDTNIWTFDLDEAGAAGITMIPGNFWTF